MQKYFFYSIIISKHDLYLSDMLIIDLFDRERIFTALSKIDSTNDTNQIYIQLIKSLSLPLNRLEKYANLLKEYLHNLEVRFSHRLVLLEFLIRRNFISIVVMHNEQQNIMLN